MRCLPCFGHPVKTWPSHDLVGLRFLLENGDICNAHKAEATERVKEIKPEPKKVKLDSTPKVFMPPIPKVQARDWNDREPNDGSLIE